eukprot:TRINITY_DN2771_c0_g1_i1.p1 TRINITY_DN2771_c0_g1~~TRINITY_DN2771_c0_g1_i1.p1  ORF type:complete len:436 (+),score=107.52 TRINITY_DN2771_c0_g1_i1:1635-2942(+)
MVRLLLNYGANVRSRNKNNWSCVNEAITVQDRIILTELFVAMQQQLWAKWQEKLFGLFQHLSAMPDFELQMKWEFSSWVPFLSRLCPSDTHTIYKRGSSLRLDTTIVDFRNYSWVRGNVSFYFVGKTGLKGPSWCRPGDVLMVNNIDRTVVDMLETMREPALHDISADVDAMLTADTARTDTNTRAVTFTEKRGWFGGEKTENIERFTCRVYDMGGLEYTVYVRPAVLPAGAPAAASTSAEGSEIGFDAYFDPRLSSTETYERIEEKGEEISKETLAELEEFEQKAQQGTLGSGDLAALNKKEADEDGDVFEDAVEDPLPVSEAYRPRSTIRLHKGKFVRKQLTAKVWMTNDFPLSLQQLQPLLEAMAPTSNHFQKLQTFLTTKLPAGFPVKVEIPVVPAVMKAIVSFPEFQWTEVAERVMTIPSDVRQVRAPAK